MCVTINGDFISKTTIKHLCDWSNWNGTETTSLNVINLPVCRKMVVSAALMRFIVVFQYSEHKRKRNPLIYTVDGLINRVGLTVYPDGLKSGIIFSLANAWAYIRWA